MADDIDTASEMAAAKHEARIAGIRACLMPVIAEDCSWCGEELSPGRRNAAPFSSRCAPCQEMFETLRG